MYSPSIGFTKQMGENAKQLVGLSGIFIGLGEVIGKCLSFFVMYKILLSHFIIFVHFSVQGVLCLDY